MNKAAWFKEVVTEFHILEPSKLPNGHVHGYAAQVPLIETPIYMPYLRGRFEQLGGHIVRVALKSPDELYGGNSLIVNCTGLGARKLFKDDKVRPGRGQVLEITNRRIERAIANEDGPATSFPVHVPTIASLAEPTRVDGARPKISKPQRAFFENAKNWIHGSLG